MQYELYLDVLFLENLLVDYLLLSLLKGILKIPAGRLRRLLGAALGSIGVCGLYLLAIESTLAGRILLYVVFSTVMVRMGLGIRDLRTCGKAVALLYISSFLLGGIFEWVQSLIRLPLYPFIGFTLLSYWLLSACMEWLMGVRSRLQNVFEVEVRLGERTIRVRGLLDTGNQLRDPIFGKPVSILTEQRKLELCGSKEPLYQMIPFHSIGEQNGILPAFFADYVSLCREGGTKKRIERPLIGVTKEPLSSQKDYDMILHPDLLE